MIENLLQAAGVPRSASDDDLRDRSRTGRTSRSDTGEYPVLNNQHFGIELVDSAHLVPSGAGDDDFQNAMAAVNRQDDGAAEQLFRSALSAGLDPLRDGYTRANIGELCIKRRDLDEAVAMLVSVLESERALFESAHTAAEYLAIVYAELERDAEAAGLRDLASRTTAALGTSLSPDAAGRTATLARQKKET